MKENEHMENNLKQIYKTLDQLYQQGDLDQTEAYLLDQEQKNLGEDIMNRDPFTGRPAGTVYPSGPLTRPEKL